MSNSNIDFFIIGYPRSGATSSALLLSRNPQIYISPETHTQNCLLKRTLSIKSARAEKSITAEKTAYMLYINKIIYDYPESRFIVIFRDGHDCVLSNIKEEWTFSNPVIHAAE